MTHSRPPRRTCSILLPAVLLLASCGTVASAQTAPIIEEADYGVVAAPPLPSHAPEVRFDPQASIANIDASVLVDVVDGELTFRDGATGDILAKENVGAEAELRAVASNGSKAALFESIVDEDSARFSRLTVVARTANSSELTTVSYDLPGLVEPEAFSTDGEALFVIDHQVGGQRGEYRVRPFDLATGELQTIVGPTKIPFAENMNGSGRRQIWSPDGTRLYTLYIRQTHHAHDEDAAHDHGESGTDGFVHVLDLKAEWAFCLDLPAAFGVGDLSTTALAVSPSGNAIAVADLEAGQIAFASTIDLAVTRVVDLPSIDPAGNLYLALTPNEFVLGWETEAHWFDRDTLQPLGENTHTVSGDLLGFTSSANSVLAWSNNGPEELNRP